MISYGSWVAFQCLTQHQTLKVRTGFSIAILKDCASALDILRWNFIAFGSRGAPTGGEGL